jgi:hypothetical protein
VLGVSAQNAARRRCRERYSDPAETSAVMPHAIKMDIDMEHVRTLRERLCDAGRTARRGRTATPTSERRE